MVNLKMAIEKDKSGNLIDVSEINKKIRSYLGNKSLKATDQPVNFTKKQVEEYAKCSDDPIYFAQNYIKIVTLDHGLINLDLWDFQKKAIDVIDNNRFVVFKWPRQSSKTTVNISYFLHSALFKENFKIAILANKEKTAINILGRLQLAYYYLPQWMQQGVREWNKKNIELENGSSIVASATSSSAARGDSYNILYLDEFAFVPNHVAEDFYKSVYPTISSGKTTKMIMTSTPNGLNMFYRIWNDAVNKRNSFFPFAVEWNEVPGRDEKWKQEVIKNTSQEDFDQEFSAEFIGSSHCLIKSSKLKALTYDDPVYSKNGLVIHEMPKDGHIYNIQVDTARGQGLDFSAFCVVDTTEYPYKLTARYANKHVSPLIFPTIIQNVAMKYNEASIIVECNDIGQQVSDILFHELEYENMIFTKSMGRAGQQISGGFGKSKSHSGIRMSNSVKKIGCQALKDLIENDQLIIKDAETIFELSTFVKHNQTFAADEGSHDDIVMCLVIFGWLVNQRYFKDNTDQNIRDKIFNLHSDEVENDLGVFAISTVDSPEKESFKDNEGNVWTVEETYDDPIL